MKKKEEQFLSNMAFVGNVPGEVQPLTYPIITDPNGSYTGRPRNPEERPVQDADDL